MTDRDLVNALEAERKRRGMTLMDWSFELDLPMRTYTSWVYSYKHPSVQMIFPVLENAGFEITIRRKDDGTVDI